MRTLAVLLALLAAPAGAQSPLAFRTDTLFFPTLRVARLVNTTAAAVPVDSVGVAGLARTPSGWTMYGYDPAGSELYVHNFSPGQANPDRAPGFWLAAGDSVRVEMDFDPCAVCRSSGEAPLNGWFEPDTLLVYAGGVGMPASLILDTSQYVNVGLVPTADALTAAVRSNPARGAATLAVWTAAGAERATIALFDTAGRRVAVLHDAPLAAGSRTFRLDGRALPPGVYLVRVAAGAHRATTAFTVVR